MAKTTLAALQAAIAGATQRIHSLALGPVPTTGGNSPHIGSNWISTPAMPTVGVAPTTAAIPDRTTAGALGQFNKAGTDQRAFLERFDCPFSLSPAGSSLLLVDRLAHVGGFDGTVITAQSNGAWPALTRFTSGDRVWAAFEIYTAVGATGTTATISYTNQAGTAGQTSQNVTFGGTGFSPAGRVLPINLAQGDTGVRAVASATVLATTGTAGNFGVTLFKTLGLWALNNAGLPIGYNGAPFPYFGGIPSIPDNACLQLLWIANGAGPTVQGAVVGFFEN